MGNGSAQQGSAKTAKRLDESIFNDPDVLAHYKNVPVLIIVGFAALLRFLFLTSKSFWTDEGFSVFMARNDPATFVQFVRHGEMNMVLYYGLLRLWMHAGTSEAFVRSFSVIASTATIAIVYLIGRRLFGRTVGLIAALLLAVHPGHISFAQEARSYALEVFLVSLSTLFLLRLFQNGSIVDSAAYVFTGVLAVYSHMLAFLIPLAQWPVLLSHFRRSNIRRLIFLTVAGFGSPLTPMMVFVVKNGRTGVDWIPQPAWHDLLVLFRFLTLAHYGFLYALGWLAALWVVVRNSKHPERQWPVIFLASWLVLPVIFVLLISIYKPMLVPRFLLMCVPAAALLAAVGLSSFGRRASLVLVGLTVAASLAGVRSYYRHPQLKEDSRGASAYVFSQAHAGDEVIVLPEYGRFVFNYYRQLRHISPGQVPYASLNGDTEKDERSANRLWVVVYQGQNSKPIGIMGIQPVVTASGGAYCTITSTQFNLIEVWLLQKCRPLRE